MNVFKCRAVVAALIAAAITSCVTMPALAGDGKIKKAKRPIKDSYVAVLENNAAIDSDKEAMRLASKHGIRVKSALKHVLKAVSFQGTESQAVLVAADPNVRGVWEDETTYAAFTQTPTPSWHLDRIDQRDPPLDNTYLYGFTGAGVTAYVIDSGITPNYGEFQNRVLRQYNFATVNGVRNPFDFADSCDHGTAVASLLGGTTYGVAKNVNLVSVRIWGAPQAPTYACAGTAQDLLDAMDRVMLDHSQNPSQAIVNWSGGFDVIWEPVEAAVKNMIDSGLTVVLAAMNQSIDACNFSPQRLGNPSYWGYNPASQSAVVVSGLNQDDSFNPYLNYGPCVDILAPSSLLTAMRPSGPRVFGATSGAAPQVAGIGALHLERLASSNPTPGMIQAAILDNGTLGRVTANLPAGTPNLILYVGTGGRRRACCTYP